MIRRRIEEVDEDGRRKTVVTEEPAGEEHHREREVVGEEEVVHARPGIADITRGWIRMLSIWVAVAVTVVEALLAFRLGFLLANANPNNGFVDFIYDITGPMVEPFQGIAAERSVNGGVLEPATAIAMGVYLVAALLLVMVLWALTAWPWSDTVVTRTRHHEGAVHDE